MLVHQRMWMNVPLMAVACFKVNRTRMHYLAEDMRWLTASCADRDTLMTHTAALIWCQSCVTVLPPPLTIPIKFTSSISSHAWTWLRVSGSCDLWPFCQEIWIVYEAAVRNKLRVGPGPRFTSKSSSLDEHKLQHGWLSAHYWFLCSQVR